MKAMIVVPLLLLTPATASSQDLLPPDVIANGPCDPRSGVTIDDGEKSNFACDMAVITRSDHGTVLI